MSDAGPSLRRVAAQDYFKEHENHLDRTNGMQAGLLTGNELKKKTLQKKSKTGAQLARDLEPYEMEQSVAKDGTCNDITAAVCIFLISNMKH